MKIPPSWRVFPRTCRTEELVRLVTSDADSTPLERELALRLERMMYEAEETVVVTLEDEPQLTLFHNGNDS